MATSPPFSTRTSGDPIADRRYAYGDAAFAEGDWQAAFDLFEQTVEIVPNWPPAQYALAKAALRLDREDTARQALSVALTLDPEDHLGARVLLAQIGATSAAEAMSPAYVTSLFDEYAPRFDAHLVGQLDYRAPELLVAALDRHVPGRHFAPVLDLGCGTGLMARALGTRASRFCGVDLSPRMLALARETGLYDSLEARDLLLSLQDQPSGSLALVIAADVFCYVPDLEPVLMASRRALQSGGVMAFTVQTHEGAGVRIGADSRVHHAPALVRQLTRDAGFALLHEEAAVSRRDSGVPVAGALYLLAVP